jgi:hypothetical protein
VCAAGPHKAAALTTIAKTTTPLLKISKTMVRPKTAQVVLFPKPYDVYLGRGKGSFDTLGNRRYLEKTLPFKPRYQNACVGQKAAIVREAMKSIKTIKKCKEQTVVRFLKKLGNEELAHSHWRAAVEEANRQSDDETIPGRKDYHLYREATEIEVLRFIQYRLRDRTHRRPTDSLKTSVTPSWASADKLTRTSSLKSLLCRSRGSSRAETAIKLGDQLDLLDIPLPVISDNQGSQIGALDKALFENHAPPLHDVEKGTELDVSTFYYASEDPVFMNDFDHMDGSLPLPELDPPPPLPPLPCMPSTAEKVKPIKKRNVRRSDDQRV